MQGNGNGNGNCESPRPSRSRAAARGGVHSAAALGAVLAGGIEDLLNDDIDPKAAGKLAKMANSICRVAEQQSAVDCLLKPGATGRPARGRLGDEAREQISSLLSEA